MEKRLNKYLKYINGITEITDDLKKNMLIQIAFFQHERLIHFLVTMLFVLITIICLICSFITDLFGLYIIGFFLLIVIGFYIKHYYILENGVQYLYNEYDRLFDKR
jgi:hypothetical protein